MQWESAKKYKQYDAKSLRVLLSAEQIESLTVKRVSLTELQEALCSVYFNPVSLYPEEVKPLHYEQGHDQEYRYTL